MLLGQNLIDSSRVWKNKCVYRNKKYLKILTAISVVNTVANLKISFLKVLYNKKTIK